MANRTKVTILEEGFRNVRVSAVGVLDTANLSAATLLTLAQCTNNDPMVRGTLTSFALKRVQYTVQSPLNLVVDWHATTNQLMVALVDANELDFQPSNYLHPADTTAAGFNGTIELATFGWANTVTFSAVFDFIKIYK